MLKKNELFDVTEIVSTLFCSEPLGCQMVKENFSKLREKRNIFINIFEADIVLSQHLKHGERFSLRQTSNAKHSETIKKVVVFCKLSPEVSEIFHLSHCGPVNHKAITKEPEY